MTTVDDVGAALKGLAVASRTLPASETKSRLLRLLDGYFQASVALAGPPMMGDGGVATVFRGRIDKPFTISEISYPPQAKVVALAGRCNRQGEPVFYGSFTQSAIPYELRATDGQRLYISRWTTRPRQWLFVNYCGLTTSAFERLGANREPPFWATPQVVQELTARNMHINSLLAEYFVSQDEQDYPFTATVYDIFIEKNHGVIYPSVAARGFFDNIAISPKFVDRGLRLQRVDEVTFRFESDSVVFECLDSAVPNDLGQLTWGRGPDIVGFLSDPPLCGMLINPGQWWPTIGVDD
ncbi:MAG: RES domain-containing protein [Chloroflexi bacterium]|nr:RES domain-containing protein [Chloroflexota bacterium]